MKESRSLVFKIIIAAVGLVFIIKLFLIQVWNTRYADLADSNSILRIVEYPYRGLIYDRHGELLVYNEPEFDLMLQVNQMKDFDSVRFASALGIDSTLIGKLFREMKARKEFLPYKPTRFMGKLSQQDIARFQDRLDEFPGFYLQARTGRAYTTSSAANALGYVSEITSQQLKSDTSDIYKQGDYIGQSGIESYYEPILRGTRGVRNLWRDAKGLEKGSFKDGAYDTAAVPGTNLVSTLDLGLQQYGEKLMNGKAGSIVAIEPSSGEILALVSGPSYDPGRLSGRNYSQNYQIISADTNKPLFNRPLMAQYRPGSIFKVAQAMIALQEGVISPETRFPCDRSIINCHGGHSNVDLAGAITNSCNPYFHAVFRRMLSQAKTGDPFRDSRDGLAEWHKLVVTFGFGTPLGVDLPNEKGGLMPSVPYYDRAYRNRPWKFSNIYSIAIGEGENLVVPMQMANFVATIANRGYYYVPHLVKSIGSSGQPLDQYRVKRQVPIDTSHFEIAIGAMQTVVTSGTATRANLPDIVVCGKTGSVQNDPRPEHSVFIAFAPRENPKIAISVYVEYGGMGGRSAAAIAGLMIERYLKGGTTRPYMEQYVLNGKFGD